MQDSGTLTFAWLDALPQAIVLHEGGRVTHLNLAAARLWGVTAERARGRRVLEVLRRHTLETLVERGGELELEVSGRALKCRAVPGALIVEDVTEARRREAELREAAAVLSHEFRTPVTGLRGVLEALQYEMPYEMQQNFVAQGLAEAERLARLVEDLAVGFRPTRSRTLAFSEVLGRAERLLAPELAALRVRLAFSSPVGEEGGEVFVRADPDKLLQVLLNLVENAARYGPHPGTACVSTRPSGGFVEVVVWDGGDPLHDEHNIWRAHVRGERADGHGSGMGLYIVRSIVEGWGGSAWVERRRLPDLGEGNAFCFTVPGA